MPPFLSICIPCYNRPRELTRLLASIDCRPGPVEVVIREDSSPARGEIRRVVEEFRTRYPFTVKYEENSKNLGYDGNIRALVGTASGEFVLFMGDDDRFLPGALDRFLEFLREHRDNAYVLRSYRAEHPDGTLESYHYCPEVRSFPPSPQTAAFMFKRTVSIAGVTFRRQSALEAATDRHDGTLLYQCHLVLEIAGRYPSVYCPIPVALVTQTFRQDNPQFGMAASESRFQPGKVTFDNSIRFTQGFFEIAESYDAAHGTSVAALVAVDLSKYSYPILSIQRKNGVLPFVRYCIRLARETPIAKTWHYLIYAAALTVLGETFCDKTIVLIKRLVGHTPEL